MPGVELLLPLVAILVGARLAGRLSQRLGMPAVLGELLAGLVLGPSVLGWVHLNETFTNLAGIGVLLLMFIAGLETDMSQLQQVGKSSFVTAIGGVVCRACSWPPRSPRPASAYRCRPCTNWAACAARRG